MVQSKLVPLISRKVACHSGSMYPPKQVLCSTLTGTLLGCKQELSFPGTFRAIEAKRR